MEENRSTFESNPTEANGVVSVNGHNNNNDHGWQKVTYVKRQRKTKSNNNNIDSHDKIASNGTLTSADSIFRSLEQQSENRRWRILEAQRLANVMEPNVPVRPKRWSDYDDDEDGNDAEHKAEDGKVEEVKKAKHKKVKKPKITVGEAAAKIDSPDLAAFLVDISVGILNWLMDFELYDLYMSWFDLFI